MLEWVILIRKIYLKMSIVQEKYCKYSLQLNSINLVKHKFKLKKKFAGNKIFQAENEPNFIPATGFRRVAINLSLQKWHRKIRARKTPTYLWTLASKND